MKKLLILGSLLALAACGGEMTNDLGTSEDALVAGEAAVCPGPISAGSARCHAHVLVNRHGKPVSTPSTPSGYGPADLASAYNLPSQAGSSWSWNGKVVAVVDAYDAPTAEADMNVYRKQFGLPPCTTASGCFTKVGQTGTASLPRSNSGWAQETSLDLDMVSAVCANCKIVLVEASSASLVNLGTSVNTAVSKFHADVVSNSYGGSEYSGEVNDEQTYYNHPGTVITVSSGDSGYGVEFPAASQYVVSVGGTSLSKSNSSRGWSETVWNHGGAPGSGCSAYVTKPSWQNDSGCAQRTVADVSAVADPYTGVAVYDSTAYRGSSGWMVFGGTSAAAPIVGAIYALAGNSVSYPASALYGSTAGLFDVTSGSNGSCGGSYLCTGGVGYDGPTGNGTPDGLGAF
jgi:subtilase family serine protease